MNLRRQLLAVSLLLLALPWAGCQFVRETEGILRSGQAQAVAASARAIAASLNDQPQRFAADGAAQRPTATANSLYAHQGPPVIVDGYTAEWLDSERASLGDPGQFAVRYALRERGESFFLLLEIDDVTPTYSNPQLYAGNGDRVRLSFGADGRGEALISTAAPGRVRGLSNRSRAARADAQRISGSWQDRRGGYSLELNLPLTLIGGHLAFEIVDADGDKDQSRLRSARGASVPAVIRQAAALDAHLARFADPGTRITALDSQGYVAGRASGKGSAAVGSSETFWLLRALYRSILRDRPLPPEPALVGARLEGPEVRRALDGVASAEWYRDQGDARIAAAAPIYGGGEILGAIRISQGSEQYLALADAATGRVLIVSLTVTALAVTALLAYATLLGWRIKRLGNATASVVDADGVLSGDFPRSRVRDEIGDLSRRFADLLEAIAGYNEYLGNLARQLGHELRTPIAVIQSSLDNLEDPAISPDDRSTYLQRARDGLGRLSSILAAMSEASRLEHSIRSAELSPVQLRPLLKELVNAYDDSYAKHSIEFTEAADGGDIPVMASAELLVQALDKLVDNAVSFAPEGSTIAISLSTVASGCELAVSNPGPALPDSLRGQLFDPMVTLRRERDDSPHLGLGLHVVRLIAEHLAGRVRADNRRDGSGVIFAIWLPPFGPPLSAR